MSLQCNYMFHNGEQRECAGQEKLAGLCTKSCQSSMFCASTLFPVVKPSQQVEVHTHYMCGKKRKLELL